MPRRLVVLLLTALLAGCTGQEPITVGPGADRDGPRPGSAPPAPAAPDAAPGGFNWSRPHVHDLWGLETSRVVMDENVRVYVAHNHGFDQPPREMHTHGCDNTLVSNSQGGSVVFTLPPGQTIISGSSSLDVQLTWSGASITALQLLYRSPETHDMLHGGTVASGDTVVIPLTRAMADLGHERRSRWDFALCAWSAGRSTVDIAEGSVRVVMTIHRVDGDLPVDPGHPDLWNGSETVTWGSASWEGQALAAAWRGDGDWVEPELDHIVPWDAREIRFTCSSNLTGAPDTPVVEAWFSTPAREKEWVFRRVVLNETASGRLEATVPIEADQTDGVYAKETHWMVWFRMRGGTERTAPGGLGSWAGPQTVEGDVACVVLAGR